MTNTTNYGQKRIKNNPLMKIGEPVLINPNSFVNIEQILNEYKETHDIGSKRQWVFIGCDGVQNCRIASKIIDSNVERYDWVSLIPGLGYLHMNK